MCQTRAKLVSHACISLTSTTDNQAAGPEVGCPTLEQVGAVRVSWLRAGWLQLPLLPWDRHKIFLQ